MFWKAKVALSKQMYENSRWVLYILRLFGLFPFTVQKERSGLFMKVSPFFVVYSFALGGAVIFIAYYIVLTDVFFKKGTIKVVSITDKIVYTFGLNSYVLVIFWGIFVLPCKCLAFFEYVKRVNQIDGFIHTTYTKTDKYVPVLILVILITLETICTKLEVYLIYQAVGHEIGLLVVEFINHFLGQSVEERLRRLNELLRRLNERVQQETAAARITLCNHVQTIKEFRNVYLSILDSVKMLENFLKMGTLIEIMSTYFQIIESMYLFITPLTRSEFTVPQMMPKGLLFCIQLTRVLLITEPWYACIVKVEGIKGQVCKLLSINTNQPYKNEVRRFALILGLREFKFTAYGLFTVDRLLFTSLIGSITTVLVILLDYREAKEN